MTAPLRKVRDWRRSRPFWGGLLMLLSGAVLFFIPLSDVFMRGAFGIVMQMGVGGYAGVLIGSVLAICGLLSWYQPEHKNFYGILGATAAVVSFPASNFGGFFLGMLLGLLGGSLTFGWTERAKTDADDQSSGGERRRPTSRLRLPTRTSTDTTTRGSVIALALPILMFGLPGTPQAAGALLGDGCLVSTGCTTVDDADIGDLDTGVNDGTALPAPTTNRAWGKLAVEWLVQRGHSRDLSERTITTALAAKEPLTEVGSELWKAVRRALGAPPEPIPPLPELPEPKLPDAKLPEPKLPDAKLPDAKLPEPKLPEPKLPELKLPEPKLPEPPEVLPLPDLSDPPLGPLLPPPPLLTPPAIPGVVADDEREPSPRVEPIPGLRACASRVVLTAGTADVRGFAYRGVADVPLARGGTVRMMMFTADSFAATRGVRGEITGKGQSTVISSPALQFRGDIVLYATKLSGKMMGVPVTLTPRNAQSRLLEVLNTVTPLMPVRMTDVTARQPLMTARSMAGALSLTTE